LSGRRFKIGSRGSQLALWQANHIADAMRSAGHTVEIIIIKTLGDQMQDPRFNTQAVADIDSKGIFTREIEEALAGGRIDLAVHSLKDLPVELDEKFILAAIPQRTDARDVLVSVKFSSLDSLPKNAVLGTTSLRRQSQLLAQRSDLKFTAMRGNVDTRLRKLDEGQVHGLILAAAGLERLGLMQWVRQYFSPDVMCPAPGQGALGVECRAEDEETIAALKFLDDDAARFAVTAERLVLASLGGGCQTPIGAHYSNADSKLYAVVAAPDGSRVIRTAVLQTNHDSPDTLATKATQKLIIAGAKDLLAIQ
jgi:hydroxymethylbilane synthase